MNFNKLNCVSFQNFNEKSITTFFDHGRSGHSPSGSTTPYNLPLQWPVVDVKGMNARDETDP